MLKRKMRMGMAGFTTRGVQPGKAAPDGVQQRKPKSASGTISSQITRQLQGERELMHSQALAVTAFHQAIQLTVPSVRTGVWP